MNSLEKVLYNNVKDYHLLSEEPCFTILQNAASRPEPKRYPDDNIITSTLQCINTNLAESVAIFLNDDLETSDIIAGVALKKMFLAIGVPCEMVCNHMLMKKRGVPSHLCKEFVENLTSDPGDFIGLALNCHTENDMCDQSYRLTSIVFAFLKAKKFPRWAVQMISIPNVNGIAEVVFNEMIGAVPLESIPKDVFTTLYLSCLHSCFEHSTRIRPETLGYMQSMINCGADDEAALVEFDKTSMGSAYCQSRIVNEMNVSEGIAYVVIDEITKHSREEWEKAVWNLRTVNDVKFWVVNVMEAEDILDEDGEITKDRQYYTLLQSKAGSPYKANMIAKKHNGTGKGGKGRCVIYGNDTRKVLRDTVEYIRKTDEELASAEQSND